MTEEKDIDTDTVDEQSNWRQQLGLAEETVDARIYPSRHHKKQWKEEAQERGLSLSKYIIRMVNQARADEKLVNPNQHENPEKEQRIQELEAKIEVLQQQLEREQEKNSGRREVDDIDLIKEFLSTEPKSLDTIIREIVESGVLEELVGRRIEDQLYFLAQNDEVEYDRNRVGWRLTEGGDQ